MGQHGMGMNGHDMAGMEGDAGVRAGQGMAQHNAMQHGGMQIHGGMAMDADGLRRRFWVCLVLAAPVLFLSPMMGVELFFQFSFPGSDWVVLALCTLLYFYGGSFFLQGAAGELKDHRPAMMTLISMGITVAYFYSLYAFVENTILHVQPHKMDFFWELATLVVIMLLGHWIEMRAMGSAGDALQKMAALLPAAATVKAGDGSWQEVPLAQLRAGQTVLVKAGQRIPADGLVTAGSTSVDESLVTGEAQGVQKKKGDRVIGGAQNGQGSIEVRVTGTGQSGYLAQVMQLVGSAQSAKTRAQRQGDRVAGWLFYVALAAGILALLVWYLVTRSWDAALTRMVTVLVIACPHALGLAIPLVTARATTLAAKNGLLVRNPGALETGARVHTVTMDKTGTLTEGRFTVTHLAPLQSAYSARDVLAMAAAVEQGSSHPLAAGILAKARAEGIEPPAARDITNLPGEGLAGVLPGGEHAMLVSAAYLDKQGMAYNREEFNALSGRGYSVSYLLVGHRPAGIIAQGDALKPGAKPFVQQLGAMGIRPVMLTGDNSAAARSIADQLGLGDFGAALLPADKEKLVRQYRAGNHIVMMVGDGVNDAPALASANLGVAIGAGTDVAIDTADVVLVRSDPADILRFLRLARATLRKMRQNLWWGAGYNIVAIPLAAGVLAPFGILLSPAVGALLMSLSTIVVAVNALGLHLKSTDGEE